MDILLKQAEFYKNLLILNKKIRNHSIFKNFPKVITQKKRKKTRQPFSTRINRDDILMLHMGFGAALIDDLPHYCCRKIMVYYNITPPDMTGDYDTGLASGCAWGYQQMETMRQWFDGIIAMSVYNKRDLVRMGYPADRIWVMTAYFITFADYRKKPSVQVLKDYIS